VFSVENRAAQFNGIGGVAFLVKISKKNRLSVYRDLSLPLLKLLVPRDVLIL